MNLVTGLTILVSIVLAFVGYLATYLNNLRMTQLEAQLLRVNRQLSEFYGPLYALCRTTQLAWAEFRRQFRKPSERFWTGVPPPSETEKAAWRLWMTEVFMPANLQMQEVIVSHADLLLENDIPGCLLELSAHVASYKTLVRRWQYGDLSDHLALLPFPGRELFEYTEKTYRALKTEQARLLGSMRRR